MKQRGIQINALQLLYFPSVYLGTPGSDVYHVQEQARCYQLTLKLEAADNRDHTLSPQKIFQELILPVEKVQPKGGTGIPVSP